MKALNRRQQFTQKKSLGQVFLREDWPCQKMADYLEKSQVQTVLEIGPGPGILTKVLLSRGINVTAVEKDDHLADRLQEQSETLSTSARLEVVHSDVLKFGLREWIGAHPGQRIGICGNIPYNISSPILMWLLPCIGDLRVACLMVQLEFGQRICATPNTKSYGSLSVFSQLRAKVRLEYTVPRTCFSPVPKVDSAVVSFAAPKKRESPDLLKQVENLTRRSFSQRRKKLSNSLAPLMGNLTPQDIPVDLNRRCETLTPAEFISIAKVLDQES